MLLDGSVTKNEKNEKSQKIEESVLILGFLEMVKDAYMSVTHWTAHVLSPSPSSDFDETQKVSSLSETPSSFSFDLLFRTLCRLYRSIFYVNLSFLSLCRLFR